MNLILNKLLKFNNIILPRYLFTCLFMLVLLINLSGKEKITFQNIHQGLSNKYIRCILKDSYGYLWFGTYNGLNRYDGTNMISYKHNPDDFSSIGNNMINAIAEDVNKNIWIATAEGLNLYNPELDNFVNIDSINGNINYLTNHFITSLYCSPEGLLWIGTLGNGVFIYHPESKQFDNCILSDPDNKNQEPNYITSIINYQNKIWVGTRQGIYIIEKKSDNTALQYYKPIENEIAENGFILNLSANNNFGLLAIVQNKGLFTINSKDGSFEINPYSLSDQIRGRLQNRFKIG